MRRLRLVVIAIHVVAWAQAQNLVPNWSFEDTLPCPTHFSQIDRAIPWDDPNMASSDLYNAFAPPVVGVPLNSAGYQHARTGNGYAGFYAFNTAYHEYIQAPLISPLQAGKEYCVSFYVSTAEFSRVATAEIGAHFSVGPLSVANVWALDMLVPQVENAGTLILDDTLHWTKISGSFIASGGESHITIGTFPKAANCHMQPLPGRPADSISYYFVDDVSVVDCNAGPPTVDPPEPVSSIQIPNIFTPNGDKNNDVFKINARNIESFECRIYNRWGTLMAELRHTSDAWNGKTRSGSDCDDGTYFYILKAKGLDGKEYSQKGALQLIR